MEINLKPTGIIRRVDDLGRIILPRDVRRQLNIQETTPMEIFVTKDGIFLKKYTPENDCSNALFEFKQQLETTKLDSNTQMEIRQHIADIEKILQKNTTKTE